MSRTERCRQHPVPWPHATGVDVEHKPCGSCSRCVSGTGRDRDETASDCWVDYLDAAARPTGPA
ncbi:hypothetical protein [Kitasatospora cineracea]|uniref:hypothetical protein n=1 Tax=Kitasatospora cineracea TaxID=88074 RepID=UPI00380C1CA1